ncbi:MAG TPA: hypothetical protein VN442_22700 [Bryobacteraceae bacterium]|nr:hypothetical protein [Bryobacteraceae bacterium]
MRALPWLMLAAVPMAAQELRLYSEFQRPDPFGAIAVPDRGLKPREILSPVLARNAWSSFWLACTLPEGAPATLYIQQNPEVLDVAVYRASFMKTAHGWVPDALEKVMLPHVFQLPDVASPIPNQTTVALLLDIRVPAKTPAGRMRLQADLYAGDHWLTYPMELRISEAVVPGSPSGAGPLPPVEARADAPLMGVLRNRFCAAPESGGRVPGLTARRLLRRNAQQDAALPNVSANPSIAAVCARAPGDGAEWWLTPRRKIYGAP